MSYATGPPPSPPPPPHGAAKNNSVSHGGAPARQFQPVHPHGGQDATTHMDFAHQSQQPAGHMINGHHQSAPYQPGHQHAARTDMTAFLQFTQSSHAHGFLPVAQSHPVSDQLPPSLGSIYEESFDYRPPHIVVSAQDGAQVLAYQQHQISPARMPDFGVNGDQTSLATEQAESTFSSPSATMWPAPTQNALSTVLQYPSMSPNRVPSTSPAAPSRVAKVSRKDLSSSDSTGTEGKEDKHKSPREKPKVTTMVESQKDRRRKQIREAQRAYRNRKDQAIIDLQAEVRSLREQNEDLTKDMSGAMDLLLTHPGIKSNPELSQRYRHLRSKLSVPTKSIGGVGHKGIPHRVRATICDGSSDTGMSPEPTQANPTSLGLGGSVGPPATTPLSTPADPPYEVVAEPTSANASFPSHHAVAPPDNEPQEVDMGSNKMSVCISPTLPSPDTYAAMETTFGRRLQRTCLERGARIAAMDNPPPDIFAAAFGFCLLFEPREAIHARLMDRLQTPRKEETLFSWKVPFLNLGGAGLHLADSNIADPALAQGQPPAGNQGYLQMHKPQYDTGFSMGPWGPEVEAVRDSKLDKCMRMAYPGFEGDFLDSDEVEVYLRQRGVYIADHADYAEAEIDSTSFGIAEAGLAKNVSPTTWVAYPYPPSGYKSEPWSVPDTQGLGIPSATSGDGGSINKMKISIDVATLVDEIANRSRCLGRTPGVRPEDVDQSLHVAAGLSQSV